MRKRYRTVAGEGTGIYEEKKSRFLAEIHPVTDERCAEEILGAVRKREYGANHHCYAYVIGKNGEAQKCSDDGEPQKTAGMPMLNVLLKEQVKDVLVVVSRYFGGTLLGTGGLVRAYESAAKEALRDAKIEERVPALVLKIETDYSAYQVVTRYFFDRAVLLEKTDFGDAVASYAVVPEEEVSSFSEKITDLTQGRGKIESVRETWIALGDSGKRMVETE